MPKVSARQSPLGPFAMYEPGVYRKHVPIHGHVAYWANLPSGYPAEPRPRIVPKGSHEAALAVCELEALLDRVAPGWRRPKRIAFRVTRTEGPITPSLPASSPRLVADPARTVHARSRS